MGLGNRVGFAFDEGAKDLFKRCYGGFVVEYAAGAKAEHLSGPDDGGLRADLSRRARGLRGTGKHLRREAGGCVPPCAPRRGEERSRPPLRAHRSGEGLREDRPPARAYPVFPGTNCEYDTERAFQLAGAETQTIVVRNLSAKDVQESVEAFARSLKQAQIVFIPAASPAATSRTAPASSSPPSSATPRRPRGRDGAAQGARRVDGRHLQRLPGAHQAGTGALRRNSRADAGAPTLTFNVIGRHQSRIVRTRVASTLSPWLMHARVGDIHIAPISTRGPLHRRHGDRARAGKGRADRTQYVNAAGEPTMDIDGNPNGSVCAIEGITSPDAACLAAWPTRSAPARSCTRTCPEIRTAASSAARWTILED